MGSAAVVQHDVLSRHQNGTGLVMTAMKISLDAAMRARDVSPPDAVDHNTGDHNTGDGSAGDGSTVNGGTGGGGPGDRRPEAAARDRTGGQHT